MEMDQYNIIKTWADDEIVFFEVEGRIPHDLSEIEINGDSLSLYWPLNGRNGVNFAILE